MHILAYATIDKHNKIILTSSSLTVILKRESVWRKDLDLLRQLIVLNIPVPKTDTNLSNIDNLKLLLSEGIGSYFDLLQINGTFEDFSKSVVENVKTKIRKVLLELENASQTIEVPDLFSTLPDQVQHWLDNNYGKSAEQLIEESKELFNDTGMLNSVQFSVNSWVKKMQNIIYLTHEPLDGTLLDELAFWSMKENALTELKKQSESQKTSILYDILQATKRTHAAVALLSNTALKDSLRTATTNNDFLKNLNLHSMLSAESFSQLQFSTEILFENFKKIRLIRYPTDRAVDLLKLISTEFEERLIGLIAQHKLFVMPEAEFDHLFSSVETLLNIYDTDLRILTNILRETLRREGGAFVPIKFSSPDHIQDIFKEVKAIRKSHSELSEFILSLMVDDEMQNYQKLYDELQISYGFISEIQVGKLFSRDMTFFNLQKESYGKQIAIIENGMVSMIETSLAKVGTDPNSLFEVFEQFQYILKKPQVRIMLQEFHSILLQATEKELCELTLERKKQLEIKELLSLRNIPSFSSELFSIKQILESLSQIIKHLELILTENWSNYPEGKRFSTKITSILTDFDIDVLFTDWINDNNKRISSTFLNSFLFLEKPVNNDMPTFKLNIDYRDLELRQEIKCLEILNFVIPANILLYSKKIQIVYKYASSLDGSLRQLYGLLSKKPVLDKFTLLIEFNIDNIFDDIRSLARNTWEDILKDQKLIEADITSNTEQISTISRIEHLQKNVVMLSEQFTTLISLKKKIQSYQDLLKVSEYDKNLFCDIISKIQLVVLTICETHSHNMDNFINSLNETIRTILFEKCNNELNRFYRKWEGNNNQTQFVSEIPTHQIIVFNLYVSLDAPVEVTKEKYILELNEIVNVVCSQKRINHRDFKIDSNKESLYFFDNNSFVFYEKSLTKILSTCAEINEYVRQWMLLQFIWDIELSDLKLIEDNDIVKWLDLLQKLQNIRNTFDTVETFKIFGAIKIEYEQAQKRVDTQFNVCEKALIKSFGNVLQKHIKSINDKMYSFKTNLQSLTFDLNNPASLIAVLCLLFECKEFLQVNSNRIRNVKLGNSILIKYRFDYPKQWTTITQLLHNIEDLENIISVNDYYLESHFTLIKTVLETEILKTSDLIEDTKRNWKSRKPNSDASTGKVLVLLQNFEKQFRALKDTACSIKKAASMVNLPFILDLAQEEQELSHLQNVWENIMQLDSSLKTIKSAKWDDFKVNDTKTKLEELILISRKLPEDTLRYPAFEHVLSDIKATLKLLPFLMLLKNGCLDESHWIELFEHILLKTPPPTISVGDVLELDLLKNEKYIKHILSNAEAENLIDQSIHNIEITWKHQKFNVYVLNSEITLLSGWDSLFAKIAEDINTLEAISLSPFHAKFMHRVKRYEEKLNMVLEISKLLQDTQKQWLYLMGVFKDTEELGKLLPLDLSRFENVSHELKYLLATILKISTVINIIEIHDILITLKRASETLVRIKKSLVNYLEKQREEFARFYFIGNDDLLEFIGNNSDFLIISKHIKKIFPHISYLKYDATTMVINSIVSTEEEEVMLVNPVSVVNSNGLIPWLRALEAEVKTTLSHNLINLLNIADEKFGNPVQEELMNTFDEYPSQIIILAFQIHWTQIIEDCISSGEYIFYLQNLDNLLLILKDAIRHNLSNLSRTKVENLMIEVIHKIDVMKSLSSKGCQTLNDYIWFEEQKFYMDNFNTSKITVRIVHGNHQTNYGFEYLGVVKKLAYTPLLQSVYTLFAESLEQKLGGLLLGPAGTGKTESVKSLGYNLGRVVFVFCCDESFNVESVGRILLGIAQIGAWGCFDEFNRLDESILSSISTQIEKIQNGLLQNDSSKIFLSGKEISIHQNTGVFITNNPNYEGRSTLPDNLKTKFLEFAMVVPDSEIITNVLLSAQGFLDSASHAVMLVEFMESMKKQCSIQKHYDFGLRNLKTVIIHAGRLVRKMILAGEAEFNELAVIQKSCYDVVLPKLVASDEDIFYTEITKFDIPLLLLPENSKFQGLISEIAKSKSLAVMDAWLKKCLQIYETYKLSHGFILVGDSGCGKTSSFECCIESIAAFTDMENVVYRIDAKVVDKKAIFGNLDDTTREWQDGIMTSILRNINDNATLSSSKNIWIVFDGDIDPTWVENLNSVLDDNKLLTLPNGERIPLPNNVRIVFEVENLAHATPATISRCGIILFNREYFDKYDLFKKLLIDFRKKTFEEEEGLNMGFIENNMIIDDLKDPLVNFTYETLDKSTLDQIWALCTQYTAVLGTTAYKMLSNLMRYLRYFLKTFLNFMKDHMYLSSGDFNTYFLKGLTVSLLWSFAGEFTLNHRIEFTSGLLSLSKFNSILGTISAENLLHSTVTLPDGMFSTFPNNSQNVDLHPHMVLDVNTIIPTADTSTYKLLICSILEQHEPLILCGPPGSGKTMLLLSTIRNSSKFELLSLNFSKETAIETILKSLEQACHYKNTVGSVILCPKIAGKWLVLFCDELNLPSPDKYGTQVVIQFLRQLVKEKSFWHPKTGKLVTLHNIQFVGACNPSSVSGRHSMTKRFTNLCTTVMVDYPSISSLKTIYNVYTNALLKVTPDLVGFDKPLCNSMIEVYEHYKTKFGESEIFHYVTSPRELTRWVKGLYIALRPMLSVELESLIRIWAYEGLRLFSDRLITTDEKNWVFDMIKKIARENFPHINVTRALETPILFSEWLSYEYQSVDKTTLKKFVKERFNVFNQEESNVDIVLHDELLEHSLRIDRVLKNSQGHMILVGASGSGKTTLAKFVSWMNGIQVVQLNVTKNFCLTDFEKILRELLIRVSAKGEKICFIIDESTILEDSFLEKMNTLLANAEVPGLFEGEEFDNLMDICFKASQAEGQLLDSQDEVYMWFVQQVAKNFHVIFTMSDPYLKGSKSFISSSALFNRCVINWMGNWPEASLKTVARELTCTLPIDKSDYKVQNNAGDYIGLRDVIINILVMIHKSIDDVTDFELAPSQFLHFIRVFSSVFIKRENNLQDLNSHVVKGLNHLKETFLKVKKLSELLGKKEVALQKEDEKARKILDKMIMDQNESERKQDMSLKMQALFTEQEDVIVNRRELVMKELNEVEVLIEEAQRGVLNIKKQHLTELRSMHNPPETIKMVLESICTMLGYEVTTWRDVQHVIRQDDFIASIINFKGEEQVTVALVEYMQRKYLCKDNFNYESANRASKACGPLLMWVKAQLKFSSIVVKVDPLKRELKKLEEELGDTKNKLIAVDSMIKDLHDEVEKYKIQYSETIRVKENIKIEMENVKEKLERSVKLLKSLSNERNRWERNIAEYSQQKKYLFGDTIIIAGFIAYCGFFLPSVRRTLVDTWKEILLEYDVLFDPEISLQCIPGVISADSVIQWQNYGLPNDQQYIGNTAILTSDFTNRYSFIIDPSGLFKDILKKLAEPKQLVVSSFLDPEFNKKLENCIKFGGSILIQDGEYYDPLISRLIAGDIHMMGAGRMVVKLGEKEIDLSPEFKLYITTKDSTFKIPPFISSRMDVLNFSFTNDYMINEALNLTLEIKEPEVESKRLQLMRLSVECKMKLRVYEKELLDILSNSKENILDDDKVLTKLEVIKKETILLEAQMKEQENLMINYNRIRNQFNDLGDLYSTFAKVIDGLSEINNIYRFSNGYLKAIFIAVLKDNSDLAVNELKIELSRLFYATTSLSLVDEDRNVIKGVIDKLAGTKVNDEMSVEKSIFENRFILIRSEKGDDATIRVKEFAMSRDIDIVKYALGSSDGSSIATKLIQDSTNAEKWVILENIEVDNELLELLPEMIGTIKHLGTKSEKFKLVMTCKIASNIPAVLIESCTQIIIQNKTNLKKCICDQMLSDTSTLSIYKLDNKRPKQIKKICFLLVWFYSILISRLRFDNIGFTKRYELNQSDLRNAERFIAKFISKKYSASTENFDVTPEMMDTIGHVVSELLIGGKIDDKKDLKVVVDCGLSLFNTQIFESSFDLLKFGKIGSSPNTDRELYAPSGYSTVDYVNWIENLPNDEPMEWIGLSEDVKTKSKDVAQRRYTAVLNKLIELVTG